MIFSNQKNSCEGFVNKIFLLIGFESMDESNEKKGEKNGAFIAFILQYIYFQLNNSN